MELQRYWRTVRRWLWMVVLFGLIAGATAAAVSYQQPRVYQSTAVALVNPAQAVLPNSVGTLDTDQLVATYVRLITVAPVKDGISRFGDVTPAQAAGAFITAAREPGTELVDIVVYDADPGVAYNVARSVVPAFNGSLDELQQEVQGADTSRRLQALVPVSLPAAPPADAVSPKPLRDGGVGLAAGLVLGLSLAFLLEYLDNTVKSDVEVPLRLELPLLGTMHLRAVSGQRREDIALITLRDPHDPLAEAYRAVRTNILFSSVGRQLRSLVVTSSIPGEGKTSTAANLAVAMAQAGTTVILVDADFRRPDLDKVFRRRENRGLGNLILEDGVEEELILPTDIPNLRLVCSGPTPPNPSELLGSTSMARVTQRLSELADLVIFDTPPVGAVTDATVLAAHADGVILVVERGRTPLPDIMRARDTLRGVGANLLGVLLNKLPVSEAGSYPYEYPNYSRKRPRGKGKGKGGPPSPTDTLLTRPARQTQAATEGEGTA